MTLSASFAVRVGTLGLEVDLVARAGETVVVVGPNGAGKTSLLNVLAGLLKVDRGRIALGDRVLADAEAGVHMPPEERGVGLVFQDYLLFPHLTAAENVAFGLRTRGLDRARAREKALAWLGRFGLEDHADARPRALSGGQAQRVALARALAPSPGMLLLDEPLSALDASARVELRRELRSHLASFPGVRIVVTHDVVEAFALAERIVVLESGRVVQQGTIAEVCGRPRSSYVADLVGLNLFRGRCAGGRIELAAGATLIASQAPDGDVFATVHPRAVALFRVRPDGTPRNVWSAPIEALEAVGDRVRVRLGGGLGIVAEVTPGAVAELQLGAGGEVWAAVKATEIAVYPV